MASHELIDAQFDRAVQIVQGLPKTGPIQTDYEEKLEMYSLYKQATVGNVKSPRPGIWDMLGRVKWDAWAKHKDLDTYEAKWLYVEALLKVLRKYSDKTIARDLVQELESYGGDPGNLVVSGSFSRTPGSDSSGSTAGDESEDEAQHYSRDATGHLQDNREPASEDEETEDDEARELPNLRNPGYYDNRPQSAQSSNRYRTPLGGSLLISPTPDLHRVPSTQPQPNFETPSAFAAPLPAGYPNPYPSHYSDTLRRATSSPHDSRHTASVYRGQYGHDRPPSRPTLEYAIENVQAHLAALTERIESLEARLLSRTHSPRGRNSPRRFANRGTQPGDPDHDEPQWDINDLGLWSVVLNPLSKGVDQLKEWAVLFSRDETRSPAKAIIRRLVLDLSFLLCVLAVVRAVWRRSGVRRREVKAALVILWRALIGAGGSRSRHSRSMTDKAV